MGWTSAYKPERLTAKQFISEELNANGYEVVAASSKGSTVYAAVRHPEGYVFGVVTITSTRKIDGFNFSWKMMDESEGPNESEMPKSVFDKLTPLDEMPTASEYAAEWRERVKVNLSKPKVSLAVGDTVLVSEGIRITNGDTVYSFTFLGGYEAEIETRGERLRLRLPKSWKRMFNYTVVPQGQQSNAAG
jgi:hypothetical protein